MNTKFCFVKPLRFQLASYLLWIQVGRIFSCFISTLNYWISFAFWVAVSSSKVTPPLSSSRPKSCGPPSFLFTIVVALRTLPMCFWCPELRSRYLRAWHSRIRPNRRSTNRYLTFSIFTSQKVVEVWIVWDCQHRLRKVDEPLVGSVRRKNDQVFFQSDQKSLWCYIRLNG